MAQSIILKRSALPGKVPDTDSLNIGEIAINTYDGKVFMKRSGSVASVETLVTTNSITTGSIAVTQTGSFGELIISQDVNIQRDLFVVRDLVTDGDIDSGGDISGSGLQINDTLNIVHGNFNLIASASLTGSLAITEDLTVLGTVNARQFNISVISSSVLFESGSSNFGNSPDDTHSFTGSVNITGSFLVNGLEVGASANVFDFNTTPSAGKVGYISDETDNAKILPTSNSIDFIIGNNVVASIDVDGIVVTLPAEIVSGSSQLTSSYDSRYVLSGSIGNGFASTGSANTFSGENTFTNKITHTNGFIVLSQVSQSLNFVDDNSAAIGGVPLGGLYRNGNFIAIRIT